MLNPIPSTENFSVIIADDHDLFADGLERIVNHVKGFEVIAKVADGHHLLHILNRIQPDLILMDINMPFLDGLETAQIIKKKFSKTKIVFISMHFESTYKTFLKENNIDGFLIKTAKATELEEILPQIMSGTKVFKAPSPTQKKDKAFTEKLPETDFMKLYKITPTEIEIIQLIAEGYSNKLIADKRSLSHYTVETHRKNIFRKLDAKNMADVVAFAVIHGIYKKP
nr:response regulator transcription factor [Pedobacter sp. ASV19]